jgi:hypothetical protein
VSTTEVSTTPATGVAVSERLVWGMYRERKALYVDGLLFAVLFFSGDHVRAEIHGDNALEMAAEYIVEEETAAVSLCNRLALAEGEDEEEGDETGEDQEEDEEEESEPTWYRRVTIIALGVVAGEWLHQIAVTLVFCANMTSGDVRYPDCWDGWWRP